MRGGFSYDKNTELLKDINFKVESGGVIAIVGPTGAGKTTLVNLLMRFYEIDKGRITIDGMDIRNMAKERFTQPFRHGAAGYLAGKRLFNGKHSVCQTQR